VGVERFGDGRVGEAIILDRVTGQSDELRDVTETSAASVGAAAPDTPERSATNGSVAAGEAVEALFEAHYARLVHLARHLLDEPTSAEDVVMDAFASLTGRWRQLRDYDAAFGYLRNAVVFGSRSRLRRRIVARRHAGAQAPVPSAGADETALDHLDLAEVADAVRRLPTRQRQCLVLRYYEELPVAQVADLLGCSDGSVKTHTSRALARLAAELGESR
jgi:RNA polymerase sigma-70 factor (sigma-E family)